MQKATVICITQGRKWAGSAQFPQALTAEGAWLSGIAKATAKPARRMKVVYRRDTKIVRGNRNIGSGFVTGGVV
jgi:hypothetical protein